MAIRLLLSATVLLGSLALPPAAFAAASCKLTALAQLPVTMQGTRPMVPATINGTEVKLLVDSGAFYSILSPASAKALDLPVVATSNITVNGIGGQTNATLATVRAFGLAGAIVNNMEFLVTGSTFGEAAGVIGQNILSFADLEYDLGGGFIRLIRAQDCKDANRVYWIQPGEKFSSVAIGDVSRLAPHAIGTAYLNGKRIRVLFDTGASISLLSVRAAERAGVKTTSAGVVEAGRIRGNGSRVLPTWFAPFQSFKIGEEEIRDTRIRIGDIDLPNADMLLGADFFLSHRVYMAHGLNKVLFTYRGGPVFDLTPGMNPESVAAPGEVVADLREPTDARGYSQRGAVHAARRDFVRAIADLSRACELAPLEPEYFYQRGRLYGENRQGPLALADFSRAVELKPDHIAARVARAGLLLSRLQSTGIGTVEAVLADVNAARAVATPEADVHLELGNLYANLGAQERALDEFDLWLQSHRQDNRAPDARAWSCRSRAVLNRELGRALDDCNSAVRDRPGVAFVLEARGLVHVRLRNFDRAIADYDKVLVEQPRNPAALYGRGLAKIGKGFAAPGNADITAARAANPRLVANLESRGLIP